MSPLHAADQQAGIEFFERRIRPVLIEHCYECHSAKSVKLKGGLRVDTRTGLRRGGDTGPSFVSGKPDESLLIKALRHDDLQMPPKGKLPESVINDFVEWIRNGAVDPRADTPDTTRSTTVDADWAATFQQRREWWSFQPIKVGSKLASEDSFVFSKRIDEHIDAGLKQHGLTASPMADRRVLARRLSFALTGLPPAMDDVAQLERDASSTAVENYVDRLLASPQFGERWARHWMDVVRYCETHGSEFDNHIPFAWRYRDYLVRAFNQDLPFDQFVREHIAGDLLPQPRWHDGQNESVTALAFWRFVEFYQTPVDVKREEGVVRDSEIDALTKAFQGLTVSCARCHDHKFDPISQRDYFALYGILSSSRIAVRMLEDPQRMTKDVAELAALKQTLRGQLADEWAQQVSRWPEQFTDAAKALRSGSPTSNQTADKPEQQNSLTSLQRAFLKANDEKTRNWLSVWLPLFKLAENDSAAFARTWGDLSKRFNDEHARAAALLALPMRKDLKSESVSAVPAFTQFAIEPRDAAASPSASVTSGTQPIPSVESSSTMPEWRIDGIGLPAAPQAAGEFGVAAAGPSIVRSLHERGLHSDAISDRFGGSVRTAPFTLTHDVVSVLARGDGNARLRLVIENHQGDHLLYDSINPNLTGATNLRWYRLPLRSQWRGLRAHVEIMTRDDKPNLKQLKDASILEKSDGRSAFGIARVLLHNANSGPGETPVVPADSLNGECRTVAELTNRWSERTSTAINNWRNNRASDADVRWLNACLEAGLLSPTAAPGTALQTTIEQYRKLENQIPIARRICGLADDGFGSNVALFPRGDHRRPGELVPRRYLEVLGSKAENYLGNASGRRQLAEEIASPTNPLTARVYVNRVWHWLFGRGLVSSVDNFGKLGDSPTHPELLDELAQQFQQRQWSTKQLVRALVLTHAFQRSSVVSNTHQELDPANRYWSRADVRRLDAESLRDALLNVAGNLDLRQAGPSIPLFHRQVVDPDKQPPSGSIDGSGRRTLYLEVRRNFLSDFLVTFDFPKPTAPTGRRSETNVPAQNLTLFNDPFVRHEAEVLAKRLIQQEPDRQRRSERLYRAAYQRPPTSNEAARLTEFIGSPSNTEEEQAAWTEAIHSVFATKEFLYLQ